ncbi:hypothetical protein [Kitasatospora sp. NPDC059673]|uniref:hypothetical protein n=1 Tax=Kitasatospora sp. NPDC059673 TaxID=3346901 RepID=UPI003684E17D
MAFVQPPLPTPRPGGRGLPGVGVLLLVQIAVELAILGYDLSHSGLNYLPIALGVPVDPRYYVPAPAAFTGYDTALVLTSLVLAFGAFNRRPWARAGAVAVLAVNAYGSATTLIAAFVNNGEGVLHQDAVPMLLTATYVADVLLALAVVLIAAAGREQSAPALPPYPTPPYPAPPVPAPAATDPAPGTWGAPPPPAAPTGYRPPQPPPGAPGAASVFPPPPPAQPPTQPPAPPAQPPA